MQFRLSSLPSGMSLATLVRPAELRRRIEHDYREMKQALGPAHFEDRTRTGVCPACHRDIPTPIRT